MLRSHFLLSPIVALFGLKTPNTNPIIACGSPERSENLPLSEDPGWKARYARTNRLLAERRIVETVTVDQENGYGYGAYDGEKWRPETYGLPADALHIGSDRNWRNETLHIRWAHESFEPAPRGRIPRWHTETQSIDMQWFRQQGFSTLEVDSDPVHRRKR